MYKFLPFLLLLGFCSALPVFSQTVILDFEAPETSTTFQYFGGSLEGVINNIVANPNASGVNTSGTVGEFIQGGDAPTWGGAFSNPDPSTPIDVVAGNQICIKVLMDHPGNLALKLEASSTGGPNWLTTQEVTTANEWVEICFDPTEASLEDPFQPAAGHVYTRVVLFFDFGTAGTGTDVLTYFDDLVVQPVAVECTTILDFEAGETSTNFQYFGGALEGVINNIVANPNASGINTSATVGEFIQGADAPTWGGAFSNPDPTIPIDLVGGGQVCIKVLMDHPGNLALKLEGSTTGGGNWIQTEEVTTANEWVEICYDVSLPSLEDPLTPASGHIYTRVVLFFDFGTAGTGTDVLSYFDDLTVKSGGGVSSFDVTFTVDMNDFPDAFTQPYVSGSFNGWAGDANPLADGDGDNIWTTTLNLPGGIHEYKFTLDNWNVQEIFAGGEECTITDESGEFTNRLLVLSENTALDTVCYNSCFACGESVLITINVGTSHIDVDSTGIFLAGGAAFGVPGDFPLTDDDGDGVWTITIEKQKGFSSFYTFTNGACPDFNCKENIAGQDCANPDSFNDRFMGPVTQDTVINTCYALCTDDLVCEGGVSDGNITFSVDMNMVTEAFTTVYVSGSFNGWAGDVNALTDDDSDGIWETTLPLPGGQHEFKFTLDNWAVQEEFAGGEDCTITDPSGQFTNRLIDVDGDAVLPEYCFNSCTACTTGVDDWNVQHDIFTLAPNVVHQSTEILFHNSASDVRLIRVFDNQGKCLFTEKVTGFILHHRLDVSKLPAGVYLINVIEGNTLATKKFVKR